MSETFAALRFTADENLSGRVYWYLCDFPVEAGEFVFAPVGAHNRVQRAEVERVVTEGTPYDPRICKRVSAKCGSRERRAGDYIAYEMGGVALDEKHYSAFGNILISDKTPQTLSVLPELSAACLIEAPSGGEEEALFSLAKARGCALLAGEAAAPLARLLIALARRQNVQRLRDFGCSDEVLTALYRKMTETAPEKS